MNLHVLVTQNNNNTIELDEKFFIKNIDTGEIYHFQNDDSYQKIFEKINPNMIQSDLKPLNPEKIWQDYWKEVRKHREKLWNSCEIGDLSGLLKFFEIIKNLHTPIDINDKTLNNYTALHLACEHGHEKIVETLLANQANIEAVTSFGRTPLHLTCSRGWFSIVKQLLDAGALVDVSDEEHNTPLHMAAEINNYEIIEELLKRKPKIDIRNYQGMTPYDVCLDVKVRRLFEICGLENNQDLKSSYSRTDLGDTILNNGRKDHVEKLLFLGQKNKKLVSTEMIKNELNVKKTASAAFNLPMNIIDESKEDDLMPDLHKTDKNLNKIKEKKQIAYSEQDLKVYADQLRKPQNNQNFANNEKKNWINFTNNDIINETNKNINSDMIVSNVPNLTSTANAISSQNSNNNTNRNSKPSFMNMFNFFNNAKEQDTSMMPIKKKINLSDFNFYKILGKGSFGEVYLVKEKNGGTNTKFYAMKVLNKDKVFSQNLVKYVKSERNILSIMDHPFIVKLNYAFQTQTKLFLILDFCPGGDLGKLLGRKRRFPEEIVRIYICEIILGIEALHTKNIIFRDLKPDNVVLDKDGHALLTDFGLSRQGIDNNFAKSFCGSVAYLAPEMLAKAGHNKTIDWYLVGVLFYELLVGIPPFFSKNREEMFNNIKSGPLLIPKNLSPEAKDLMKRLLCRNPKNRLGALLGALEVKGHPFFRDVNWDDVMNRKLVPPEIEVKEVPENPDEELFTATMGNLEEDQKVKDINYIEGWSYEDKSLGWL